MSVVSFFCLFCFMFHVDLNRIFVLELSCLVFSIYLLGDTCCVFG